MINFLKLLVISAMAALLSSCLFGSDGYIHNRENGYLQAQSTPSTQLPPTVAHVKLEANYPVPEGQLATSTTPISIVPPGMPVGGTRKQSTPPKTVMTNQMLTNAQVPTLKINNPYSAAWKAVNAQLAPLGYQVLGSDKVTGIIEVKTVKDPSVYQFYLEKYRNITLVTVLDQQGQAANTATAQQMLEQLAKQLDT